MRLSTKIETMLALGLDNIGRVLAYRLGVKTGLNPVRRLRASSVRGPFFLETTQGNVSLEAFSCGGEDSPLLLFGRWEVPSGLNPPDWFFSRFSNQRMSGVDRNWWDIPDFDPVVGDIKIIWELSRFDWVLRFARHGALGDESAIRRLNVWLDDWCEKNPPYTGPNWKCGQEASIRVMHLAAATLILDAVDRPTESLVALVALHLQRIAPTIQYAMAQDNNHGTSEAAALFIGGSLLITQGKAEGRRYVSMGRRWLEDRARRLIGDCGSFSQYSVNYHRVMLDTLSIVEVWRRRLALPEFSEHFTVKARLATLWLYRMVSEESGDAPNLGANDGARLLQLTETPYRDHRPSVQLGMVLFSGERAYGSGGLYDEPLSLLGIELPEAVAPRPKSYVADDGGFALIRRDSAMVLLRYPRFHFRPSQADGLHLDFWLGSRNLLRDAGTYSYNTDAQWLNYFGGTAGHNTVQFDGRDQMPRLGRFLFGGWLKTSRVDQLHEDEVSSSFGAAYRDDSGACHARRVRLGSGCLSVEDEVSGFARSAVLRWRLEPGDWQLKGNTLMKEGCELSVSASVPVNSLKLVEGWESRHYLEKTSVPVLEVEVSQPVVFTTHFSWTK